MGRRTTALATLFLLPLFVFMSVDEGHGGSATKDFIGKTVNFLVLFGALAVVLRKPVREMLRKRSAEIQESLAGAKERRAEAEKRYAGSAARLAGLETEVLRVRKEAEEDASRGKDRIARLAAAEAEKIRMFTEQEIEEHLRVGLRELISYAGDKAANLAGERIREKLGATDQKILIDKSIERLAHFYEKSGSHQ